VRTALEEVRRIKLKASFGKSTKELGWTSLNAWRARHDSFTASIAPMVDHLLVGYFNQPVAAERTIEGKQQREYVREGTLSLIPAGTANVTRITAPVDVVHVYIPAASLRDTARCLGIRSGFALQPRLGFEDKVGSHLLKLLASQLESATHADELFAEHLSELINLHLLRQHADARAFSATKGGLAPWQLRRVQAYLDEHLDQPVTLGALAALAQRSRSHFISAFRQSTGATPHAYLLGLRVAQAKALLLKRPDRSLCDIAHSCGFSSQSHLTDGFANSRVPRPRTIDDFSAAN
jgi:AraC family transcriptional regulator